MTKVFINTDIILDLFAKRQPFYKYAAHLFTLADHRKLEAYVSSLSFPNLYFILSKLKSKHFAVNVLKKLKAAIVVLPVDDKIVNLALASEIRDFKDAIQYYTAIENGIEILITRNIKDYKPAKIPVMSAETFVKTLEH